MSDAVHYRLHSPKQAHDVMVKAWDYARAKLATGSKRLVLEIRQETRSSRQNRLLHAMLGDIAAQVEWAGAKRDVDTWKRLMVASWCRIYRRDSGCCSRASMCGMWGVFHPATCASCGWARDLLLSSVSRKGASQHSALMGLHGQRRMWAIKKMDELDALNVTIERLLA